MESSFTFLRDQIPIPAEAFIIARSICSLLKVIKAERKEYLTRENLAPEIFLPSANWSVEDSNNIVNLAFNKIVDGDYDVINNLRMFSQSFSGFSLDKMLPNWECTGPWFSTSFTEIDKRLEEISKVPDKYCSLYFQRAAYMPAVLHIAPPRIFGEVGWNIEGRIVNHDAYVYLERIALLHAGGVIDFLRSIPFRESRPLRILEVGGGFGGLAYHLKKIIPNCRYYIVDLPESLIFSSIYLNSLFPLEKNGILTPNSLECLATCAPGFTFIPNFFLPIVEKAGQEFDLVINTLSLSEMSQAQAEYYAGAIKRFIGRRGVFYEQNGDNQHLGWLNLHDTMKNFFQNCTEVSFSGGPGYSQGVPYLWRNL